MVNWLHSKFSTPRLATRRVCSLGTSVMKYLLMIACLCSLPLWSAMPSPQSEDDRTLAPGAPIEREISVRQSHYYRIGLTAGQFVQAFVQQKGREVLATLLGPDGRK